MISVRHYQIELDVDGFNKTKGGLIIEREGTNADTLPLHGVITKLPLNAKFKEGDTAYFSHFALSGVYKDGSRYLLNIPESDIYAIKRGDKWIRGTMIPAERIKREKRDISTVLITPETAKKEEYYNQRFKTDEGIVWIYKSSSIRPPYLKDRCFIRPNYIIYNETKDRCENDFVILKLHPEKDDFIKSESGIYLPQKVKQQRGKATVVKDNKYNLKGDVLFLKSTHNSIEHEEDLATVKFQYILGCYEKN